MFRSKSPVFFCSLVLLAFWGPGLPGWAATIVWTGSGATTNWSDVNNWFGGATPGATDTAQFDSTGTKNCSIDSAASGVGVQVFSGYTGTLTASSDPTFSKFIQFDGAF